MRIGTRNWLAKARGIFPGDPRYYQILSLGLLLGYGKCCLQFDIGAGQLAVTLGSVLGAQFFCSRLLARAKSFNSETERGQPCPRSSTRQAGPPRGQGCPRSSMNWSWSAAFDPKSALISGLSLCLLLRTNSLLLAMTAAFAAIAGKFVLRWNGKHIFNPTNFGLVIAMLCAGERVWVSPGQWGN